VRSPTSGHGWLIKIQTDIALVYLLCKASIKRTVEKYTSKEKQWKRIMSALMSKKKKRTVEKCMP
jgi:hypothetical protein